MIDAEQTVLECKVFKHRTLASFLEAVVQARGLSPNEAGLDLDGRGISCADDPVKRVLGFEQEIAGVVWHRHLISLVAIRNQSLGSDVWEALEILGIPRGELHAYLSLPKGREAIYGIYFGDTQLLSQELQQEAMA